MASGSRPIPGEKEELDLADEVRRAATLKEPPLKSEAELEKERYMVVLDAYLKELDESEGFDVGDYRDRLPGLCGMTAPADCSKEELEKEFSGHCLSAIELYNKSMDAKFKFVEVEKATCTYMSYHITFTAREDENEEPKVFQAFVGIGVGTGEHVAFCRQKGKPDEGYNEYWAEGDDEDDDEDDEGDEADQDESGQPSSQ